MGARYWLLAIRDLCGQFDANGGIYRAAAERYRERGETAEVLVFAVTGA
jgi:hypothetical protein